MEILSDRKCIIGEGPIWNAEEKRLYQVNGYGAKEILCIDPETKECAVRALNFGVAAIGFTKNNEMLISCADGAFILERNGTRRPIYDCERYEIRYGNDAKVGPDGRFYIGTQSRKRKGLGEEVDGKLYSIDKDGEVKLLLDGMLLSNGFDWSMDEKRFYHTDSDTKTIKEYDFDKESGEISFTGRSVIVPGVDGFTVAENDFLFVACWGQGHIAVVDTADMRVKEYISVPARIPASCAFFGENMDRLAVVTATLGADPDTDKSAGCTFMKTIGVIGRAPYLFG